MTRKNSKLAVSLIMIVMFGIAIIDSVARANNGPDVNYRTVTIEDVDIFYREAGAEPYKRDLKNLEYYLLDTGHFALETHGQEIADLMRDFLNRKVVSPPLAAN